MYSMSSAIGFQATLSATTSDSTSIAIFPHHPISCTSKLYYHEDGRFECEHATAPADDRRTQAAVRHSIAVLILELAEKYY